MHQINRHIMFGIKILGIVFMMSGCIAVRNSPSPRFYVLKSVMTESEHKEVKISKNQLIGIGSAKIPENMDRPQIVTQDQAGLLKFAQFDRWGEPLTIGVARLIREDLSQMIPKVTFVGSPWNREVDLKYKVEIEIIQLDSVLDKDLDLVAQWMIIDGQSLKTMAIKKTEFHQPITPHDHTGLARALSMACGAISHDIADGLATLTPSKERKDE